MPLLSRLDSAWAQTWASLPEPHQYALRSEHYTAAPVDAEYFATTYDRHLEGIHTPIQEVIEKAEHTARHQASQHQGTPPITTPVITPGQAHTHNKIRGTYSISSANSGSEPTAANNTAPLLW